jgi:hypothetical protein
MLTESVLFEDGIPQIDEGVNDVRQPVTSRCAVIGDDQDRDEGPGVHFAADVQSSADLDVFRVPQESSLPGLSHWHLQPELPPTCSCRICTAKHVAYKAAVEQGAAVAAEKTRTYICCRFRRLHRAVFHAQAHGRLA